LKNIFETLSFIANHLKAIAIAGLIFWLIVLATLDVSGLIDLEVDCPWCLRLMPSLITDAMASSEKTSVIGVEPVYVRVRLLPGLA
jgi:hypothetical protein